MSRHFFILVFMLLLLADNSICRAQQQKTTGGNTHSFIPREITIFEDDFSQDSVGTFPSKWRRFGEGASRSPKHCQVMQEGSSHALVTSDIISDIEPNINSAAYITDSFTFELDFMLGIDTDINTIDIDFNCKQNPEWNVDMFSICGDGNVYFDNPTFHLLDENKQKQTNRYKYPGDFKLNAWHHLAITSKNSAFRLYIDQFNLFTIPPHNVTFSSFSMHCIPPGKVKNIRLATGKLTNVFENLLTENKFTTHAINFDVNKSIIKPESMGFITQLAQFMKANPAIKLEIDGHTDNDGDAAANVQLSQQRADEVKKQLLAAGVSGGRLTTRGLGATKPLQPNTTPEAKANNRRVEFIKFQ